MCPASTVPLQVVQNGQKPPFPSFPCFSGFLWDSGGPSLPVGPECAEGRKVARMATLRLFVILGPFGTPGSRPPKEVWEPYSWPPECTESGFSRILGGHTAHFAETSGSHLF